MSICLVALVVLAVLSIFSAKYRRWAREAFDCVARRLTLRPCVTGFNEKVRATITSKLMKRHMGLARFAHRHFEVISWIFTVIMFISLAYTAYGFYNLATMGTCDPVTGDCIFNPGGNPNRVVCPYEGLEPKISVPTIGGFRDIESAVIEDIPKVYFFGTTWCPHCGWERSIFSDVIKRFSGYIDAIKIEIDQQQPESEIVIFNHYSPEGKIPVIIISGKYFRIGSGEELGEETERAVLTALLCKVTNNPIDECEKPDITELMNSI